MKDDLKANNFYNHAIVKAVKNYFRRADLSRDFLFCGETKDNHLESDPGHPKS
jgi:hypothetical protein